MRVGELIPLLLACCIVAWEREKYTHPLSSRKAGELALGAQEWESGPCTSPGQNSRADPRGVRGHESKRTSWLLAALSELEGAALESAPWWCQWGKAGRQTNTQDYELAHPNIHLIYELLEHVKGPNL